MAFVYENTPVLSKIKIGSDYYYVKDADLRTVVDSFNADIVKGEIGAMSENNKLVYSQNIKAYVDAAVKVGIVIEVVETLPTASADTMGKLYLEGPKSGGKTGDYYDEYVTVRSGAGTQESPYVYTWEKIGDTRIDLSAYVTNVGYVAADHKLQQTKNGTTTDVHQFGGFADANQGSGKLNTVDSAKFTYTPAGTVAVTLKDSDVASTVSSTGTFTPAGTVAIDAYTPAGTVTSDFANADTLATVSKVAYTPAGTVTVGNNDVSFKSVDSVGELPSFVEGSFTPASLTKGTAITAATQGVVAAIGTGSDAECLIFTAAATDEVLDYNCTFNGGSKAADTWSAGSLPTTLDKTASKLTGTNTFAGTEVADALVDSVTYKKASLSTLTFAGTQGSLTAGFTGSEGNLSVSGSYNKQVVNTAEFTGTKATDQEVVLTKTEKTVTVAPVQGE